jgi:hypothetical protein
VLFPDAAAHSAWARVAILRPGWLRGGEQLLVTYESDRIAAELNCASHTLWSGPWDTRVVVDGQPLEPCSDWRALGWHSDDDVDYLELEIELIRGWRLQRQILLARQDHFLFTADAVLGGAEATIQWQSCLPLVSSIEFRPAAETREGHLIARRRRVATVLPLFVPEWRAARSGGELQASSTGLIARHEAKTCCLYAPLFIDLARHRFQWPVTWRQLTVAQDRQIQPSCVAAGYRVQIGREQWLFYRSFDGPASRTLLGQHIARQFLAAQFDCEGLAEELLATK